MKKIRNLTQRSPIFFAIVATVVLYGIHRLATFLLGKLPESTAATVFSELVQMAWPILIAILMGYGFACRKGSFAKTFKAGWFYFAVHAGVVGLVLLHAAVTPGTQLQGLEHILVWLLTMLGVGIREEFMFRGIVANIVALKYVKDVKGLWITTVLGAVLFGSVHMGNALFASSFSAALFQSLGCIGAGLILLAIYLRGGNIWVVAIMHAVVDTAALNSTIFRVDSPTRDEALNNISIKGPIIMIPLGILAALFLFRKSKRQAIFDRYEAIRAELND